MSNFPSLPQVPLVDTKTGQMNVQWQGYFTALNRALNALGGIPPTPTSPAVLAAAYKGAWSGTVTYYPGDETSRSGNVYRALQENLNVAPVNGATWLLVGPLTMDWIANGGTYGKPKASAVGIAVGSGNITTVVGHTSDTDIASTTIAANGGSVEIDATAFISTTQFPNGVAGSGNITIHRDGATIGTAEYDLGIAGGVANGLWAGQVTLTVLDTPSAGNHTYTMHVYMNVGGPAGNWQVNYSNVVIKAREYSL